MRTIILYLMILLLAITPVSTPEQAVNESTINRSYSRSIGLDALDTFNSTWDTTQSGTSNSDQVRLPLVPSGSGGNYDFVVDWGDGSTNTIVTANYTDAIHTYDSSGTYTIVIDGKIYSGKGNAGHLGHCAIKFDGKRLGFNQGSLESYVSAKAIKRDYGKNPEDLKSRKAWKESTNVNQEKFYAGNAKMI